MKSVLLAAAILGLGWAANARADEAVMPAGAAAVDITPDYPVRLSGFGFRRAESEGVTQRIRAKALALGGDDEGPAVLITVDNLGVPADMVEALAEKLRHHCGIAREKLAVCSSHTHTAPMLSGVAPTLFGEPIPPEHQQHIERYTRELGEKLEQVARAALADRRPARLSWGVGSVGLAVNRRKPPGPVDHDLPLLAVHDVEGRLLAVLVSYACHCVTLSNNRLSGDWAGYAQEQIEKNHPGAVALTAIGCGADANPSSGVTGDKSDVAAAQGAQIAAEVERLLAGFLAPVQEPLRAKLTRFDLPLAELPTRDGWLRRAAQGGAVGYHARVQLERLDRGQALRDRMGYSVQSWVLGDALAMVFLPGEVVADYSLRLKRELDRSRLWVNAYANDDPCYIPSERVLAEGGYEGGDAMIYYDVPTRFAPGLEEKIVAAVREQLPAAFRQPVDAADGQGARPLSPQQSLAALRTHDDLVVELVAAEPLVIDPVAIDFAPDGRLFVAEMHDYPSGLDGQYQPGGRVRVVSDADGDGRYDTCRVFLDGIPFPTGVTVWRGGVLVCAAPDILYAEDTDGDGRADVCRKLFSGFATHNYQARVNSLSYGLDGWVYGSGGLFGGEISSFASPTAVPLANRDFRLNPDSGAIEAAAGRTQQGRARNDWGDWFGCDNSTLIRHYPLADHYLRRNPHLVPPPAEVYVPDGPESNRLFPAGRALQTFKLSGPPNRATAACGLGIYRDELLGGEYAGNSFTCEPVNLVVHRLRLEPRGVSFAGHRADDEQQAEFLASTDNWFRPVQARTGPDGALWIVDMYRYVIEHPRWIPPEEAARLDVRAGHTLGRIYCVYAKDRPPRPIARLDQLDMPGLVAALDSPNGPQRDLAAQMLAWRNDAAATGPLETLFRGTGRPETRLQALCSLDALGTLDEEVLLVALADEHAGVRRHAVRLAEHRMDRSPDLLTAMLKLAGDADPQVRLQLACSLGESTDPGAAAALGRMLAAESDEYLRAALLSSVTEQNLQAVTAAAFSEAPGKEARGRLVATLLPLAAVFGDTAAAGRLVAALSDGASGAEAWQFAAAASWFDALERRGRTADDLLPVGQSAALDGLVAAAREIVRDEQADEALRLVAVRLLGRQPPQRTDDVRRLAEQLVPRHSVSLQGGIVAALGRVDDESVPDELVARWTSFGPSLRGQVLDVLLSRAAWRAKLLTALEQGVVPPAQIDAVRRQALLERLDEAARQRAERVLAAGTSATRKQVLDEFQDVVTMTGDVPRGKTVFARRCAACHQLEGVGFLVGPDLAALTARSPQALLAAILDPNQAVEERYQQFTAVADDGRTYTGILVAESSVSITLKAQEGKQQTILRSELEQFASNGKSLMPEGLERDVSKQELADLIAYVAEHGPARKQLDGNAPRLVVPDDGGSLRLTAANCEIYGDQIVFEPEFQNLGFWHAANDHAVWTLELPQPKRYDVYLDYACDNGSAGNRFTLESAQPLLEGRVEGTGGWNRYRVTKIGEVELPAGRLRLTLRPSGQLTGALFDLRGVLLVPAGSPPP